MILGVGFWIHRQVLSESIVCWRSCYLRLTHLREHECGMHSYFKRVLGCGVWGSNDQLCVLAGVSPARRVFVLDGPPIVTHDVRRKMSDVCNGLWTGLLGVAHFSNRNVPSLGLPRRVITQYLKDSRM
jgi:hypothetical protein